MKGQAAVILGMHRSGTSALARAFSFCGFALPTDLMQPQPDNPKGFWESTSIVQLNEEILAGLGSGWQDPALWHVPGRTLAAAKQAVAAAVRDRWLARAASIVCEVFGDAAAIVVKDPRISLFLPLWRDALREAGYEPSFILIHRNPLDVAASLRRRNGMALRAGIQLWQRYLVAALDPANGIAFDTVVAFEDLLALPVQTMQRLTKRLGASVRDQELADFIAVGDAHHSSADAAVESSPIVSAQVKLVWDLLRKWEETSPEDRTRRAKELCASFDDAMLLCGPLKQFSALQRPQQSSAPASAATADARAESGKRPVQPPLVLHYHLFKNAGTSVDEMLKQNFGARWEEKEFATPVARSNVAIVEAYLKGRPDLRAFSSHTATLPLPQLGGREVFPIIFLRHPVSRLKSAYEFERKQDADTFGARLAKQHDFPGYLRALLALSNHRQARNFQTYRLALGRPGQDGGELNRARAMLAALPFCGLVEEYDKSMARLESLLTPVIPEFRAIAMRKNVTKSDGPALNEKLEQIAKELGADLNQVLWEANADDIALFEEAGRLYN
jgi:hypothetical protein